MPAPGYFEIHADDLARARKFYGAVFGWSFTEFHGSDTEYWRIETHEPGAMMGGLLARPGTCVPGQAPNAYVVTLSVSSVDTYLSKAVDAGAKVALPKWAIPGVGWQAYLIDTEKNIFGLHQRDAAAK
ncbi:MAG TPA: VOC family protein [Rhizomicrobium sp.]|nr:VOC family protein [Rhizomicrobium sp.]